MKKFFMTMLGVLLALPALARDFEYEYEGQKITYTVLDEDAKTVTTKAGNGDNAGNFVSGSLILPSHPKDGNVEYTLTSIGNYAFYGCDLTSVEIPNSVTFIGDSAFYLCYSLTTVEIPNSVTFIGDSAFAECSTLTSVVIPNSVTFIGDRAFTGCGLTSVEIPNSVTFIGDHAFEYCYNLTSVVIPNSVTSIGIYAFAYCFSLTSVEIPNSVTFIGDHAFEYCYNLTSVKIPNSVTSIGNYAFAICSNLTSVYYNAEEPISGSYYIFNGDNDFIYLNAILYVPEEAVETFKQTEPWMYFQNIQGYNFSSGIEDVTTGFDETLPCEYFNLSGVKAGNTRVNLTPGTYIMRQGNVTKKIVVK